MVVLRADTLRRALVAANDNELVWPLIPLFDGFSVPSTRTETISPGEMTKNSKRVNEWEYWL